MIDFVELIAMLLAQAHNGLMYTLAWLITRGWIVKCGDRLRVAGVVELLMVIVVVLQVLLFCGDYWEVLMRVWIMRDCIWWGRKMSERESEWICPYWY